MLVSSAMLSDPFPAYTRLRQEAPIAWSHRWNAWIVSRYTDVDVSLRDKENLSNENRQALLFDDMAPEQREALAKLRHYYAQKDVIGSDPPITRGCADWSRKRSRPERWPPSSPG